MPVVPSRQSANMTQREQWYPALTTPARLPAPVDSFFETLCNRLRAKMSVRPTAAVWIMQLYGKFLATHLSTLKGAKHAPMELLKIGAHIEACALVYGSSALFTKYVLRQDIAGFIRQYGIDALCGELYSTKSGAPCYFSAIHLGHTISLPMAYECARIMKTKILVSRLIRWAGELGYPALPNEVLFDHIENVRRGAKKLT